MEVTRLTATDAARAARVLGEVRASALADRRPRSAPRPAIRESWERMLHSGIDPDHDFRSDLLSRDEVERRRQTSRLRHVLPVLREGLLSLADTTQHIMMVADADARVLWREGSTGVLRKADGQGLGIGADWREETVGTNGVGTPLVSRRPVQVFSAEHFVRVLHSWTCTGAPVTDPRDGSLLGAIDISGPLETLHPSTLALVDSVAKLAQAHLRDLHLTSLEQLRAVAAPVLARLGGRALAVDKDGWTAAVTGMPYTNRLALPKSLAPGRCWLPTLGLCSVDPLSGGWLIRPAADPAPTPTATHIRLDVSHPRRWTVTVSGNAGSWTHDLTPRHAELLYLLALHRSGRSASALADDMFGDPARTVTIRAEMSRVRRYLGAFLDHRPYRFTERADVEVLLPKSPLDLLPHSVAPGVVRARAASPGGRPWEERASGHEERS
ncbi:helix-turn-helix domain-containing protein [Streptomyces ipomoeae]|uniref:helix-turn-helix domain-containing protein n=1 Tax=Streptomyces ipomoeae TaxID=103232 RepID=UPI00114680D2|nr:helix-turn-helix domain-containing protein [Streptomyces ipomoeae]MDX2931217.1 GAF domain-containing protein [Streptomyces ipomoeae]TQE16248.1 transcriptional regulator [Streptomyces ipomoeae]